MSAQLSFPPDKPTITRSPSSISAKSVMALVVFFAILRVSLAAHDVGEVRARRRSPFPIL
jgi:hypothetical protein